MATILHCDACKFAEGTPIDGGVPLKVWHGITLHGKTMDLCTVCLGKIEKVLGFELFDKTPKPTPKQPRVAAAAKALRGEGLRCGSCNHGAHEPGKCEERICDAAGDMDWCPC